MRYVLKQKLFSWGDDFIIKNALGEDSFFVDGKVFTLGNQLSFQDMARNELAFIKQKAFAWGPTYEIYRSGQLSAVVKKKSFTFLNYRFTVDVPGPDDLIAEGDMLDRAYVVKRGSEIVATVSKDSSRQTDTYNVDIDDSQDAVLVLACAVVIDMACYPDSD
jgi:uncharacterized protein YxjI